MRKVGIGRPIRDPMWVPFLSPCCYGGALRRENLVLGVQTGVESGVRERVVHSRILVPGLMGGPSLDDDNDPALRSSCTAATLSTEAVLIACLQVSFVRFVRICRINLRLPTNSFSPESCRPASHYFRPSRRLDTPLWSDVRDAHSRFPVSADHQPIHSSYPQITRRRNLYRCLRCTRRS